MMNTFLANALADFLGKQPRYVPADPAEFADAFQNTAPKVSDTFLENDGKGLENDCARPKVERHEIVVVTPIGAGRALCMGELAKAMGCSPGEASRRVALAGKKVKKRKSGRHVFVSLAGKKSAK